jgi:hypothetical protein
LTQAIASPYSSRHGLLAIAAAGVLTGLVTPLLPPLIERISSTPGDFRIALAALPFALLVAALVPRAGPVPWWAVVAAGMVTMIAFVGAVNAAMLVDGLAMHDSKAMRNVLSGLAGGFVGAGIMAIGVHWMAAGSRPAVAWFPMLLTGMLAGTLVGLANALRRTT